MQKLSFLTSCKGTFALLDVGGNPFFSILALETELLEFAFQRQALGKRYLSTGLHRALNTSNRLGGLVGWAERAGILHNLVPVALGLVDVVDKAELLGFFKAEKLALGHQFDSLVLGKCPCHALCAACAGEHAKADLGQSYFTSIAASNTDITGQGNLQAAADRVTIQSCDDEFGRLFQAQ